MLTEKKKEPVKKKSKIYIQTNRRISEKISKMTLMEGTLWKWTNYLSGWQPRFFVLDVGVLAYYKSQEEVGRGSKGSIKMGCCEITVHPTDNVRIDLKIPPDQYIYLRAATSAERQQWLVALGTSKACLTSPQPKGKKTDSGLSQINQLKERMQELSMYRSLLLQQINTIKLMCVEKEQSQEFSEAATMLSATCDEFLKNLCDCMDLADANFSGAANKSMSNSNHSAFRKHLLHDSHRTTSPPSSPTSSISSSSVSSTLSGVPSLSVTSDNSTESDKSLLPRQPRAEPIPPQSSGKTATQKIQNAPNDKRNGSPSPNHSLKSSSQVNTSNLSENQTTQQTAATIKELERDPPTFFSTATHKFEDVKVTDDGGIPVKSFLAACSSILPFFDVLGSTAFAPVKLDIGGNIKKLSHKFDTDPKAFHTLQNMVYQEIKSNTCTVKNSATDALLWLKRALEFMQIFLLEVVKGTQDLAVAAGVAYEKTLRKYHGWVVRGVFALAVKAVPYREDFLTALGTIDQTCAPPAIVLQHIKVSVTALGRLLDSLNQFYLANKLDVDYTV